MPPIVAAVVPAECIVVGKLIIIPPPPAEDFGDAADDFIAHVPAGAVFSLWLKKKFGEEEA